MTNKLYILLLSLFFIFAVSSRTGTSADGGGDVTFADPSNASVEDGNVAIATEGDPTDFTLSVFLLDNNGTVSPNGDDANPSSISSSLAFETYRSFSAHWGLTLSPTLVNDVDFGCFLLYAGQLNEALNSNNYGFTVPGGATVDSITVSIKHKQDAGAIEIQVDATVINVYYTEAAPSSGRKRAISYKATGFGNGVTETQILN